MKLEGMDVGLMAPSAGETRTCRGLSKGLCADGQCCVDRKKRVVNGLLY